MEEENKPLFEKAVYTFLQDTNTNGSTGKSNEDERIEITYESSIGDIDKKDNGFFVIRTKGWSINDLSEIADLFKRINNVKI